MSEIKGKSGKLFQINNCSKIVQCVLLLSTVSVGLSGYCGDTSYNNPVIDRIYKQPCPRVITIPLNGKVTKDIKPPADWLIFGHWRHLISYVKKLKSEHPETIFLAYFNPTYYFKYYSKQKSLPFIRGKKNPDYIKGHNYVTDILPHKNWFVYRKGGYIPYEKTDKSQPEGLWDENALSSYYYPPDHKNLWFTERNMDMTNTEWQNFAANMLAWNIRAKGYDGLYMDDITMMYKVGPGVRKYWRKHILPKVPGIEKWIDENLDYYYHASGKRISEEEWENGLREFVKLVKSKLPDKLILYNGHYYIRANVTHKEELFQLCDGWMAENFLNPHDLEARTWNGYLELVEKVTSTGRLVIAIPPRKTTKSKKDEFFHLTSCLLTDALYWDEWKLENSQWYQKIALGYSSGKRYELKSYPGVWVRKYDNGVVIVNSNKHAVKVEIPWKGKLYLRKTENNDEVKNGNLHMDACSGEIILF